MRAVPLAELTIDDERSFAHVALYGRLKQALLGRTSGSWSPLPTRRISWDRATVPEPDLLDRRRRAVRGPHPGRRRRPRRLAPPGQGRAEGDRPAPRPPAALFFAEAIASAFDLYLVGRLLPNAPDADFIATQVPIMSDCAQAAGLSEAAFAALLEDVARAPEAAFEELRALLFDAANALYAAARTRRRPWRRWRRSPATGSTAPAPLPALELDPLRARLRAGAGRRRPGAGAGCGAAAAPVSLDWIAGALARRTDRAPASRPLYWRADA